MRTTDELAMLSSTQSADVRRAHRHVPGEPGLWILLFGDLALFTLVFAVYLHQRGQHEDAFAQSQESLNQTFGAVNTLILLTSSLLVFLAVRAYRNADRRSLAFPLMLVGALVGSCFVVIKLVEYHAQIADGHLPVTNEFFMYYYVLTGLHLLHVIVGLAMLAVLARLARKRTPTKVQVAFFEGGACFWHMVDLLWIVIFPLVFLVR